MFLSAMRSYRDELIKAGYEVVYLTLPETDAIGLSFCELVAQQAEDSKVEALSWFAISDRGLRTIMADWAQSCRWNVTIEETPGFVTPIVLGRQWFADRKQLKLADFYKWQRQRLQVLLVGGEEPVGGKWSFDTENRQALPTDVFPPQLPVPKPTVHVREITNLVAERFADHPGSLADFAWPTTRKQALAQLRDFVRHRLPTFGPYQDALTARSESVFHSLLTPSLNMGLLTPNEVVQAVLKEQGNVPLASLEGFIRQVIGWREFIFLVDDVHGEQQESENYFNHTAKLSDAWYTGKTGLPPLDAAIMKCQRTGYAHHIERLMVIGNVMLLAGIHPHEAYRWFMEMFVDSAQWVMGPNVYGMALFSDGGLFATKPYCCASSYWRKQAGREAKGWDHLAGKNWGDGLDGLYWDFVERHQDSFSKNHRMVRQVWGLKRLKPERRQVISQAASELRQRLTC